MKLDEKIMFVNCKLCGVEIHLVSDKIFTHFDIKKTDINSITMTPISGICQNCFEKEQIKSLTPRAEYISQILGHDLSLSLEYAKQEKLFYAQTGIHVDIIDVCNKIGTIGSVYDPANYRGESFLESMNKLGKIGDEIKINPVKLENEPSRFFGKPKNNYKK